MAPSTQQRRFSQASASTKQSAQLLIAGALQTRVNGINPDECDAGNEDAFFVADLGDVYRQHMRWKVNLPRIEPFYGMLFLKSF
jgi:ornithine decarboxylase